MELQAEIELERYQWLVALLLSFAILAERAAGAPDAMRRRALPFLCEAEDIYWELAFGADAPFRHANDLSYSASAEDAAKLARSFRGLAVTLWTFVVRSIFSGHESEFWWDQKLAALRPMKRLARAILPQPDRRLRPERGVLSSIEATGPP